MKRKTLSTMMFVLSASMLLAACASNSSADSASGTSDSITSSDAGPVVSGFHLNTDSVKTSYDRGEDFDATGLTASATVTIGGVSEEKTWTLEQLNVDSSSYNKTIADTYFLPVSPKDYPTTKRNLTVNVYGELQVDDAKTVFNLNDEFSSEGLKLSYYRGVDAEGHDLTSDIDSTNPAVTVDSSKFDASHLGTYEITVSYKISEAKVLTDTYEVEVQSKVAGLVMQKETTTFTLSGQQTMDVPLDDISVYWVDQYGQQETTALDSSKYSLSYYKGAEKIDSLNGVGAGLYQIWATRSFELYGQEYEVSDFVFVTINDPVTSLTFVPTEATTTQEQGTDTMTSTWNFTVGHSSGRSVTVGVGKDKVVITGLDTQTVTAGSEATATYTEADTDGTSHTVTTAVSYKITQKEGEQEYESKSFFYQFQDTDATTLTQETTFINESGNIVSVMATSIVDQSVTIDGNEKTADGHSFKFRCKLAGKGKTTYRSVKVVLPRDGTLTMWYMSSSSTETRSLAFYDSNGQTVENTEAWSNDGKAIGKLSQNLSAGTYFVWGSGGCNIYGFQIDTTVAK